MNLGFHIFIQTSRKIIYRYSFLNILLKVNFIVIQISIVLFFIISTLFLFEFFTLNFIIYNFFKFTIKSIDFIIFLLSQLQCHKNKEFKIYWIKSYSYDSYHKFIFCSKFQQASQDIKCILVANEENLERIKSSLTIREPMICVVDIYAHMCLLYTSTKHVKYNHESL